MPKSQLSWVWSQHPPTQWNLRAGRWSRVLNKVHTKKSPCFDRTHWLCLSWEALYRRSWKPTLAGHCCQKQSGIEIWEEEVYCRWQGKRVRQRMLWRSVPERCVPELKVSKVPSLAWTMLLLEDSSLHLRVSWTSCLWPMCPDPGPHRGLCVVDVPSDNCWWFED